MVADLPGVPIVFSTASMERYGGSSTPTFVLVDRAGVVRRYTPTRLTEAELTRSLTALVKRPLSTAPAPTTPPSATPPPATPPR